MKISEEYLAYNVKDAMFGGCGTIVREECLFIIFWRIHRCPEGGLERSLGVAGTYTISRSLPLATPLPTPWAPSGSFSTCHLLGKVGSRNQKL